MEVVGPVSFCRLQRFLFPCYSLFCPTFSILSLCHLTLVIEVVDEASQPDLLVNVIAEDSKAELLILWTCLVQLLWSDRCMVIGCDVFFQELLGRMVVPKRTAMSIMGFLWVKLSVVAECLSGQR